MADRSKSGPRPESGPAPDAGPAPAAVGFDPTRLGWITVGADPGQGGTEHDTPKTTAAVTLRPWRAEDRDAYRALLDDPALWVTLPEPYPNPVTPALADEMITLSNGSPHHTVRAVIADGQPVGQVRLQYPAECERVPVPELSFWIGRAHWGKGYASAAVRAMIDEHAQGATLTARVLAGNAASRRILWRAGFVPDSAAPPPDGWERMIRPGSG